jgi:hypothetical protein
VVDLVAGKGTLPEMGANRVLTLGRVSHATLMSTPIPPKPPRWEPSEDPSSIVVPGLDTTASVNDQIDQIEQHITIKLQVCACFFALAVNIGLKLIHLHRTSMPTSQKYRISWRTGFCPLSNDMRLALSP